MTDVQPQDLFAVIKYKNGNQTKQEFYYGFSFLSQSGRFLNIENNMASVIISSNSGQSRTINLNK